MKMHFASTEFQKPSTFTRMASIYMSLVFIFQHYGFQNWVDSFKVLDYTSQLDPTPQCVLLY